MAPWRPLLERGQNFQRLACVLGDIELGLDHLAHDALAIDDHRGALVRQPATASGQPVGLRDRTLRIAEQRVGKLQGFGKGRVPLRRVVADADDLGAERSEFRVVPAEITRLEGSTGGVVFHVEEQHQVSISLEILQGKAPTGRGATLESGSPRSFAHGSHG